MTVENTNTAAYATGVYLLGANYCSIKNSRLLGMANGTSSTYNSVLRLESSSNNTFESNTTPTASLPATNEISDVMLRSASVHWDHADKERREMYIRYLQIIPRKELDVWTALNFANFEHSSQVMIFGAIACRCSDLFHAMVARGII